MLFWPDYYYLLMKSLTTTFAALVLCVAAFGQDWNILESSTNYTIYFAKINHQSSQDGIDHERIVFSYENHTEAPLVLAFNRVLTYAPDGIPQEAEKLYEVEIPPHSTVGYDQNKPFDKTFYIFSKDNKGTIRKSLMDFKLTNLHTN